MLELTNKPATFCLFVTEIYIGGLSFFKVLISYAMSHVRVIRCYDDGDDDYIQLQVFRTMTHLTATVTYIYRYLCIKFRNQAVGSNNIQFGCHGSDTRAIQKYSTYGPICRECIIINWILEEIKTCLIHRLSSSSQPLSVNCYDHNN